MHPLLHPKPRFTADPLTVHWDFLSFTKSPKSPMGFTGSLTLERSLLHSAIPRTAPKRRTSDNAPLVDWLTFFFLSQRLI